MPAGGWFHTGDQGFLDEEDFLTLTGRIKELINRGGEKISPIEVLCKATYSTHCVFKLTLAADAECQSHRAALGLICFA